LGQVVAGDQSGLAAANYDHVSALGHDRLPPSAR
jgi:hypothetical protein